MNSSESTKKVAQQFGQALADRDLDGLLTLFADTVDWYIPGNEVVAPWTGKRSRKSEIEAFFRLLWKNTELLQARIEHLLTEGDFAVITGEFSTRMLSTGKVVDSLFSIHLTVSDDLIVRYRLQEDSFAVVAALQ